MGELDKNEQPLNDKIEGEAPPDETEQSAPSEQVQSTHPDDADPAVVAAAASTAAPAAKANRFKRLVGSRKFKIAAPILTVLLVAAFAFVPPLKYLVLNLFSSTSADVVVVDDSSLAPVEGAQVALGKHSAKTDTKGHAKLTGVPYGSDHYTVTKEAYTTVEASATLGTGSNLIGPVKLHSAGVPVTFKAVNTLNKQPLNDFTVRITDSNVSAQAGKTGIAILKVPASKLGKISFTLSSQGFNDALQQATVDPAPSKSPIIATLTPAGKHYFLSNRSGRIDVYSSNLDGTDPAVVIAGTGAEGNDTALTVSPDAKHAALVSKRDKLLAADGSIQDALYLVDFQQKTIKRLDDGAPSFNVIGWSDNSHIIYDVDSGNYQDPNAFKFKLSDTSGQLSTLASMQYSPGYTFYREDPGHLYYIMGDATVVNYGINSIDLTSKKSQRLTQTPPDNNTLIHAQPFTLSFKINGSWSQLNTKTQQVHGGSQPTQASVDDYVPSPDGARFAWTEIRDGKGSLILGDQTGGNPHLVVQDPVASSILTWSDKDYITYNSVSQNNSADYIVYLPTGTVTKISNVFEPTYGPYGH